MSCWLCIPSARDNGGTIGRWRDAGYKLAIFRQTPLPMVDCDLGMTGEYPGYAQACNSLIRAVLLSQPDCDWVVCAGDDTLPDFSQRPNQIAIDCGRHFGALQGIAREEPLSLPGYHDTPPTQTMPWSTFGVMQPTGDRWGDGRGAYIDRVAGSPWIGRDFAMRMYGGRGPYCPEYAHMGVDEEVRSVAIKVGAYWERPDLKHEHRHWGRTDPGRPLPTMQAMPDFLRHANSPEEWQRYKRIYETRLRAGFPGHEPLKESI